MLEVTSISASSYDPESLVPLLDERVKDGWSVISIVSAGTKVVAYLQRDTDSAPAAADEVGCGDAHRTFGIEGSVSTRRILLRSGRTEVPRPSAVEGE